MRLSTTLNLFIPPYTASLDACKEEIFRYKRIGFTCLDAIMCGAGDAISPLRKPDWKDWVKNVRDFTEEAGITIIQSHVPFYNFATKPSGIPDDMDEMVDRAIEAAAMLGAKYTVAHPATALGKPMAMQESRRINLEYFKRRLEVAEKCGIGIAIENMADFDGGGRNRWYCAYVEELSDLIDTLSEDRSLVGACWDFGHANLVYPSQREALIYLGERLKITHTHDNGGQRDDHLSPYRGTVNWTEIMHTLKEINFTGDLSFEVRRILNPEADPAIIDSLWRHLLVIGNALVRMYDEA
ncbi:MAG: sugar phosphate isomerase/epimerase [Clostridia bacterium]|nr:sugar phosphate isomerase/epimerase [Clostridia bacterium]